MTANSTSTSIRTTRDTKIAATSPGPKPLPVATSSSLDAEVGGEIFERSSLYIIFNSQRLNTAWLTCSERLRERMWSMYTLCPSSSGGGHGIRWRNTSGSDMVPDSLACPRLYTVIHILYWVEMVHWGRLTYLYLAREFVCKLHCLPNMLFTVNFHQT